MRTIFQMLLRFASKMVESSDRYYNNFKIVVTFLRTIQREALCLRSILEDSSILKSINLYVTSRQRLTLLDRFTSHGKLRKGSLILGYL